MKKNLRRWTAAVFGAVVVLGFSSCAYDPYYTSTSVGGSYSTGYGDGYGYGGSGFNTSVFVSTGDPRWGYDPYNYSYYDYTRRSYYDPYLNGYYPIGYRPPIVVGVPHPHGWRPGRGYCPPPRYVTNRTVVNYRNRADAYRGTNYDWAPKVKQGSVSQGRVTAQRPDRNTSNQRPTTGSRPSVNQGGSSRPQSGARPPSSGSNRVQQTRGSSSTRQSQGRLPSNYNTPVTRRDSAQKQPATRTNSRQPQAQPQRQAAPRQESRGREEESRPGNNRSSGRVRSLGQG